MALDDALDSSETEKHTIFFFIQKPAIFLFVVRSFRSFFNCWIMEEQLCVGIMCCNYQHYPSRNCSRLLPAFH